MNPPAMNINVDDLPPGHSAKIKAGDAIQWSSARGRSFTISSMVRSDGNGPAHPFEKHFPNPDPPDKQVHSGKAVKAGKPGDKTSYKYTVQFDDGGEIDPTVIIEQ